MPLYRITPAQVAVSAMGIEYRAREDGLFALPKNDELLTALANHGLQLEETGALPEELDLKTARQQAAEQEARIAELQAEIERLRAAPPPAAVLTTLAPEPPPAKAKPAAKPAADAPAT